MPADEYSIHPDRLVTKGSEVVGECKFEGDEVWVEFYDPLIHPDQISFRIANN